MRLLEVENLTIVFPGTRATDITILDHLSFDVNKGEILGIVGESGSGKTMTAYAIAKLLPPNARISSGRILFHGTDLLSLSEAKFRKHYRGKKISIIFQDPVGVFNPVVKVGHQLEEMLRLHRPELSGREVLLTARELLGDVHIPDIETKYDAISDYLSGGMAQRIEIAIMALATRPELLIADEPTTGLDVTIQAQVLDLLANIVRTYGITLILITHDFGLVAEYADRVLVMKEGRVEEVAETRKLFATPQSSYTKDILSSMPRIGNRIRGKEDQLTALGREEVLRVDGLKVHFPIMGKKNWFFETQVATVRAVDGISFGVHRGEIFGVVGESGCGKTTLVHTLLGLREPTEGSIRIFGEDRFRTNKQKEYLMRQRVQGVAQNPQQSLNQFMRVRDIIGEGLDIYNLYSSTSPRARDGEKTEKVARLMAYVGLSPERMFDFPGRMSGGEQQRVALARALATNPEILVLDEPTSSLDTSRKKAVLELMLKLQKEMGLTYIVITHELPVVAEICDRVAVMYLGKIVEMGSTEQVFFGPLHPYTQALLASVPIPDPERARKRKRQVLSGEVPSASNIPLGCRFHPRCAIAEKGLCDVAEPQLEEKADGHFVACHKA